MVHMNRSNCYCFKKHRIVMKNIIKLILTLLFLCLLSSCRGSYADYEPPPRYAIKYEVTGTTSSVNIIYEKHEGYEEYYNQSLPWVYEFDEYGGRSLYLSAQNNENTATLLTATIYIDGSEYATGDCNDVHCFAIAFGSTP